MRITKKQVDAIHSAIGTAIGSTSYKVFLFGSRTKVDLVGGDIDIAIVVNPIEKNRIQKLDLHILTNLKKQSSIGDRRIDLKIYSESDLTSDPFAIEISKNWLPL